MEDAKTILELTDFRMAGFLVTRGVQLRGLRTNEQSEVVFIFGNEVEGTSALAIAASYPGSPEQRYDGACKTMHDLTKMRLSIK